MLFSERPKLISVFVCLALMYASGCGLLDRDQEAGPPEAEREALREEQQARQAEAMRRLSSDDRRVRERAALELLSMGDERSLSVIKEVLSGPADPEAKVDILHAISFRADRRCFDIALKALRDPDQRVNEAAAAALANFTRPGEIESIIEYAQSPELDEQDRELIFRTMGDGLFVVATPILVEGLKSEHAATREAAWQSLRRIWDRDLPPSPEPWLEWWELNLHRSREEILEERLKAAEINLNAVRQRMRELERGLTEFSELAMSDRHKSPLAMVEALRGENLRVREYAAFTLSRMSRDELKELDLDDRDIYTALRDALLQGTQKVAVYIAGIIERLDGAFREELILDALQIQAAEPVKAAISAVRDNPAPAVVNSLEELLRHHDAGVREAAANALGKSTQESTVAALRNALKDEKDNVRWFAIESLRKLNATRALPDLTELLEKDPSPTVRNIAAMTLGQFSQPAAFPALRRALQDENRLVREQAAKALAALAAGSPERTLSIGEALVESGFLTDAKRVMDHAAEKAADDETTEILPQIDSLKMKIADGLVRQERYADAAALYSQLLEIPEHAEEARHKLLDAYIASGNYEKLLENYAQRLQTDDPALLNRTLEDGVLTAERLNELGQKETASILTAMLTNAAGEIDPPPDNLLERLESLKENDEPGEDR